MSAQCKIQVRFCGAGAGMGAVLRKGAVLGTGAGMVRVRVGFAGAGAGKNFCALRSSDTGFSRIQDFDIKMRGEILSKTLVFRVKIFFERL